METLELIKKIPKAELHLHIEGTLEPELMLALSKKNKIEIPFKSIEEVKAAYEFEDLQSFLNIYYAGANVLQTQQDFYDLTWAYLERAKQDNVTHCEIFFDPQTHTARGIDFSTVVAGIHQALEDAKQKLQISCHLILCFLRDQSEASALEIFEQALDHKDKIIGVGLDSAEVGHPPKKFEKVFAKARDHGFKVVAHAGEEGPADYIWDALNTLKVERIDHGIRAIEDPSLMEHLKQHSVPLTVCPLSNIKLKCFDNMTQHNIMRLLNQGLLVTINSDDPAYFGGYVNENYKQVAQTFDLTCEDIIRLAKNSFEASFISDKAKQDAYALIERVAQPYLDNDGARSA